VVQPAHGSFPELIEMAGGGILVPPGDPRALAAALCDVLNDPDHGRRLGEQGMAAVRQRFDAATMARRTIAVYDRFVK